MSRVSSLTQAGVRWGSAANHSVASLGRGKGCRLGVNHARQFATTSSVMGIFTIVRWPVRSAESIRPNLCRPLGRSPLIKPGRPPIHRGLNGCRVIGVESFSVGELTFRPFTAADAPFVLRMWSREEIWRYSGGPGKAVHDLDQAVERIEQMAGMCTRPGTGAWLVQARGVSVGRGVVQVIPLSADAAACDPFTGQANPYEVGWHVDPELWGRGYATAIGRAMVKHAARHGITHPLAVTHADNLASQAVAVKVGMQTNGVCERYYDQPVQHFHLAQPAETLADWVTLDDAYAVVVAAIADCGGRDVCAGDGPFAGPTFTVGGQQIGHDADLRAVMRWLNAHSATGGVTAAAASWRARFCDVVGGHSGKGTVLEYRDGLPTALR